ncbi:MAG: outer membrane lipoprotein-sorting protein [Pseudomonadota bacterium]
MRLQITPRLFISFLILFLFSIRPGLYGQETPSAEIIARKVSDREAGRDSHALVVMKLIDKNGKTRVREMEIRRGDFSDLKRTLIRFNSPAEIKGTGFLTIENENRDDDQYLFLPELRRSRRIVSSQKDQKFVNSDFTYEDMQRRKVEKDTHRLLGSKVFGSYQCWILESTPKPAAESQYDKLEALVTKDNYIPVRINYYSRGKTVKTYTVLDLQNVNGFWTDMTAEMYDLDTRHKTVLEVKKISYNTKIKPDIFTVRNLEKY